MKVSKKSLSVLLCFIMLFSTIAAGGASVSAEEGTAYKAGDIIYYGSYPQSEVKDAETISALNAAVADNDWQSYGYYSGNAVPPELITCWHLRSPGNYSDGSCNVGGDGCFYVGDYTNFTYYGVRPALQLNLSSEISESEITFGSYPQTLVDDEALIASLDSSQGEWVSYGYYSGSGSYDDGQMAPSDYMRYKDISFNGVKYRGVTFDSYRPYCTGCMSEDYSDQQNNNYFIGNVYWFRYEPITWHILDSESGLTVSDIVLDSQAFNNYLLYDNEGDNPSYEFYGNAEKTFYASDYANSSIRAWLNDDFMNTAFSAAEQNNIKVTALNNDGIYTLSGTTGYEALDSASTNDKVFLLSYDEALNENYFADNEARKATASDYAKCQGVNCLEYSYDVFCNGEMTPSDFMRYADVTLNGKKYRGVTFDEYRPINTGAKLGETVEVDHQKVYGYTKGNVYWFKYNPVKWRVLDPDSGFVLCDTIIDSQPYNNYIIKNINTEDETYAYFGDAGQTFYACDWANSNIRNWLNDDFYNTAFTDDQKANINETANSNKGYYTLTGQTGYEALDSADTTDKVFLLSYDEAQNENYFASDEERIAFGSDYALYQGLYDDCKNTGREGYGSPWRLRSPGYDSSNSCYVHYDGGVDGIYYNTCYTTYGVRPALKLMNLKSEIDEAYLTLHCPVVTYTPGFEAYGVGNAGATVILTEGETVLGKTTVDKTGKWSVELTLQNPQSPSYHEITATLSYGGETLAASKTVKYNEQAIYPVEFTLFHRTWESGRDYFDRTLDLLYFRNTYFTIVPGHPLKFTVKLNTNEGVNSLRITSTKGSVIKYIDAEPNEATGEWTAEGYFYPNNSTLPGEIGIEINGDEPLEFECTKIEWLMDPSGFVYEAVKSNRVEGATATIYTKDGESKILWDANPTEQENPETTDGQGVYHWDVSEGSWIVKVEKEGYETAYSEWMDVPPEWTEVAIPLVSTSAPVVESIEKDGNAFVLTFSQYMDIDSVNSSNVVIKNNGSTVTASITPVDKEASGKDDSVYYASVFKIEPADTLAGKIDISVGNVKNYAGTALEKEYTYSEGQEIPVEKEYTAKFVSDGKTVSEKQYKEGEAIAKPADPSKDGYTFKGWTPDVPATMPANDLTFTAVFEKIPAPSNPTASAQLKVPSDTEVGYAVTLIVKAKATDVPEGYYVALYDGETLLEKGSNTEVSYKFPGEFKTTKNITAKIIDDNGNVQKDADGNYLTATFEVKARSGFFARLIAFFKRLFVGVMYPPVIVEPK